jgi:hypothetical protein
MTCKVIVYGEHLYAVDFLIALGVSTDLSF